MATYRLRKMRRALEKMGATIGPQQGRKHAKVQFGARVARWPNPHDDPIDESLLSTLLGQLGVSRDDFFANYK